MFHRNRRFEFGNNIILRCWQMYVSDYNLLEVPGEGQFMRRYLIRLRQCDMFCPAHFSEANILARSRKVSTGDGEDSPRERSGRTRVHVW